MSEPGLYTEAYDAFIASLDIPMRDAVTKLMLHTHTRPDNPNMVGVCLTAVATRTNATTQERLLEAQQHTLKELTTLTTGPDTERGMQRISNLRHSLDRFEHFFRNSIAIWGFMAGLLALCWLGTLVFAWEQGYSRARNDIRTATHEQVCNDVNGYIAGTSSYWRNSLGMSAAADRLAKTAFKDCPR